MYAFHGKKGVTDMCLRGLRCSGRWRFILWSPEFCCGEIFIYLFIYSIVSIVATGTDCICFWIVGWLCILKDASSWHGLV